MQNRIFLKVNLVLAVVTLLLSACQGKQDDAKRAESNQAGQNKEGNRDKQQVTETPTKEVPVDIMAKVGFDDTDKESSEEEIYVNWRWNALKKEHGGMKGIRTWLNGEGLERKKKLVIKNPYVHGKRPTRKDIFGLKPVDMMRETKEGKLYFLCNVDRKKPWRKNYLVTDSSGEELYGGKLDLKELVSRGKGKYNKYLWFTNMEVSGKNIIASYKSSRRYRQELPGAKCGILYIDIETGEWSNRELDIDLWWTDSSLREDMQLNDGAIYSLRNNKTVSFMKYNTGEEMQIDLPDIKIPEPVYDEWGPWEPGCSVEGFILVGRISYHDEKLYLLDVYGNLYVCDINGECTFELLFTDKEHSYPPYTIKHIQISNDGNYLYASFWEGPDEHYEEGKDMPYYWLRYQLK